MRNGIVIFDGDDTLWETMPLYARAKERFTRAMAKFGLDPETVLREFEQVDLHNLKAFGFGRERFPNSMVDTYRHFCTRLAAPASPEVEAQVREIGRAVFTERPQTFPDADAVLAQLRLNFVLVLMTKGDAEVQQTRVSLSGLQHHFDRVYVVANKAESQFLTVLRDNGIAPQFGWSVGNSIRADINPALRVGMRAVWIPYTTWDAEVEDAVLSPCLHRAGSLSECLHFLRGASAE